MNNAHTYRAGEIVPKSGDYSLIDNNGISYTGLCLPLLEGEAFPPVDNDEHMYMLG